MRRMLIQTLDTKVGKSITFQSKQKTQKHLSKQLLLLLLLLLPATSMAEIMATLPPLASIVHLLDKDKHVQCILGNNSDPHHTSISPQTFEKIKKATVLRTSEDQRWKHLSPKVSLILWHQAPHAWLEPEKVYHILPKLVQTLQLGKDTLIHAQNQIITIQKRLQKALEPLKKHGVIMQHGAWKAVFEHYGVTVHLVLEQGHQHGQSVSPRRLQKALTFMKQNPKVWLIADQQHDTDSLRWLQNKRPDSTLLILDTLGDCYMSWQELMKKNIQRIENTL